MSCSSPASTSGDKKASIDDHKESLSDSALPYEGSNYESEEFGASSSEQEEEEYEEEDDESNDAENREASELASELPQQPRRLRGRPSSCVFVASLSAAHSDDHLCLSVKNHFEKWGEITLVKVLRDQVNRPYAFVQYTSDQDAAAALAGAQHNTLDGRTIRVEPAKVNRTLYITPLKESLADEEVVSDFLSQFGEVEELVYSPVPLGAVRRNKNWFAKFAYRDDAIRAYASLRLDSSWSAEWTQNLESPTEHNVIDKLSIFVGQLDSRVTREMLVERFGRHGEVVDCNLIIRHNDPKYGDLVRNTSFAFIKFSCEQAAAEAVEQENHTIFMDKTIHVQYRELYHQGSHHHHHNHQQNHHHGGHNRVQHHAYRGYVSREPRLQLAPPPINLPSKYEQQQPAPVPPVPAVSAAHYHGGRIATRHSSLPMTPIPARKGLQQQTQPSQQPQKPWKKYSPQYNTSTQAHRGSPYITPSPTATSSPSSYRQSPQSIASSATSLWGQRKGEAYTPPHRRRSESAKPVVTFSAGKEDESPQPRTMAKLAPPTGSRPFVPRPKAAAKPVTSPEPGGSGFYAAMEGAGGFYSAPMPPGYFPPYYSYDGAAMMYPYYYGMYQYPVAAAGYNANSKKN
ncbi:hypothetical protein TRVA0_004S01134 [Trichomonascus vanleenenianus]|uniref:Rim4p n=1 Tax=Trichomonascus vanleenenianus TaxID=2268995 RepID=UPI003ECB4B2E